MLFINIWQQQRTWTACRWNNSYRHASHSISMSTKKNRWNGITFKQPAQVSQPSRAHSIIVVMWILSGKLWSMSYWNIYERQRKINQFALQHELVNSISLFACTFESAIVNRTDDRTRNRFRNKKKLRFCWIENQFSNPSSIE